MGDGRWEARALLTPTPQSAAPGPHPHRKPLRICSFSLKDLLLVHFQLSANRGAVVGGSAASCYTEGSNTRQKGPSCAGQLISLKDTEIKPHTMAFIKGLLEGNSQKQEGSVSPGGPDHVS